MNDTPCVKQMRSPAMRFWGDLIRLMAETLLGVANLLMPRGNHCLLQGTATDDSFREWPECVD